MNKYFIFLLSLLTSASPLLACPKYDVNGDGNIGPLDALLVINALNSGSNNQNADVNCDGNIGPLDVLLVINCLNSGTCTSSGSGNSNNSGNNENSGNNGNTGSNGAVSAQADKKISSPEDLIASAPSTPPPSSTPNPPTPTASPTPPPPQVACKYAKFTNSNMYDKNEVMNWDNSFGVDNMSIFSTNNIRGNTSTCMAYGIEEAMRLCRSDGNLAVNCPSCYDANNPDPRRIIQHYDPQTGIYTPIDSDQLLKLKELADKANLSPTLPINSPDYGNSDGCVVGLLTDSSYWDHYLSGIHSINNNFSAIDYSNNPVSSNSLVIKPTFTRVFDENCRALSDEDVSKLDPAQICPNISARFLETPISFNWEESSEIQYSIVQFPLGLTDDKYHVWQASSKTPLLVYDPEHKGNITSATQLFGNWTFGGKRKYASMNNDNSFISEKWENGYEALAVLDMNKDGYISQIEAKNLGLWFDHNQNGKSEEGEVKSIEELKISKIFYKNAIKDALNKGYMLRVGFERESDKEVILGSSFDWFSDSYDSPDEAINIFEAEKSLKKPTNVMQENTPASDTATNSQNKIGLTGVWKWVADSKSFSKNNAPVSGYLLFNEYDTGIWVVSMQETPVEISTSSTKNKRVSFLNGKRMKVVRKSSDSNLINNFSFVSEDPVLKNFTDITVYKDGINGELKIKGQTVTTHNAGIDGKSASLAYGWTATKYQSK